MSDKEAILRKQSQHIKIRSRLRDTSGASIVIALVFFLICGIVGSAVVTAASVQAKSVQMHKDLQQAEFTVGSAAQVIADDLQAVRLEVTNGAIVPSEGDEGRFGNRFWEKYGSKVLEHRAKSEDTVIGGLSVAAPSLEQEMDPVYGTITIDEDLNVLVDLSLSSTLAPDEPYNMSVYLQCIPSYDARGNLKSFEYEEPVIRKSEGAS